MNAHEGAARPTGTVTFMFTDIEGSTVRWERDPAAMRVALRRHDAIVGGAVAAHSGWTFKTVGDAFCVAFARPADAIAACIDVQRALATEDFSAVGGLRVRAALHTGTADEREGDYFGPAVNRVARMLGTGYGGQILLSGSTADIAAASLPPEATLIDLGEHRLRDLERPENVYQLSAPGLQRDFPPLRSLRVLRNNLPQQLTSFVGRERELADVIELLGEARAVTLVGPGGIGKTRIALQAGAEGVERWPDGVWFVELGPIADGTLVPAAVTQAAGLQSATEGDPVAALTAQLASKRLLLIFDNCEHLIDAAAATAAAILRASPGTTILASSRQPLGIAGERAYRVPSLALPEDDALPTVENALRYGAVELFVARAQAADSRFRLTAEALPAVVSICKRLDGIALALELAAARTPMLGLEQLQRRLDQRFRLLAGGRRDAIPRQQTLRAAIDWSYDLLDENERRIFRGLSIFVDGFTDAAASAVASRDPEEADAMFDILGSLADKSLIQPDPSAETVRFRMLESMRAYGLEKLDDFDERRHAAERHLAYFHALAQRAESAFRDTGSDEVFMRDLAPELDDLRAALDWALNGGDVDAGAALIGAAAHPWSRLGHTAEGIARLRAFIAAAADRGARTNARLWSGVAWLAGNGMVGTVALDAARRAVDFARESGDPETLTTALEYLAIAASRARDFATAMPALDEAERLAGDAVPPGRRGRQLELRGFVGLLKGDLDMAARAFDGQRDVLRSLRDEYGEANVLQNIAELEHARGNTVRALDIVRELQPRAVKLLGREQYANMLSNMAGYLLALGDTESGAARAREALELVAGGDAAAAFVSTAFAAAALCHLALAIAMDGNLAAAATLHAYCDRTMEQLGYEREYTDRATSVRLRDIVARGLSKAALDAATERGRAISPQAAVELARAAMDGAATG